MANPIVTITMENGDVMKAELYPEIAPNTVNNFISLVKKGSDCVAYGAHQSFDRTPQNTQKGPPQQTRSASNGRTEARFARLSQSE